jgi:nitrite reductase/ring-hydroxylating ferredoxin subunit
MAELLLLRSEVPDGSMKAAMLDGEEIVVANIGGRCFAFGGICTHEQAPLSEGMLDGQRVICPWHSSEFDVTTGAVIDGPADEPIPVFKVEMIGDTIRVLKP